MRSRTLLLLASALTCVPVAWYGAGGRSAVEPTGGSGVRGPTSARALPSPTTQALRVLQRWDERRSEAWAAADVAALARLYVPSSQTGDRDRRDLGRWAARGLRVTGLRQQIEDLRVVHAVAGRWVVVVTERTVGGVAVDGRRHADLPASAWSTHRIRLERSTGRWLVAEVRDQPAR